MIKYENIESTWFTEGFSLVLPSKMSLLLKEGTIDLNNMLHVYPDIELDIESDPDLDVQYDIYLLQKAGSDGSNIHIDRTELGLNTFVAYEGDGELIHTILSFTVPAGTTDLNDIDLTVRTVFKREQEVEPDEIPTEE